MAVTREQAMDNAARILNNVDMRCGPPDDTTRTWLAQAGAWLQLAQLADPPDGDDELELVDSGQVDAFNGALALARDLAVATYEDRAGGRWDEYVDRARTVVILHDGWEEGDGVPRSAIIGLIAAIGTSPGGWKNTDNVAELLTQFLDAQDFDLT